MAPLAVPALGFLAYSANGIDIPALFIACSHLRPDPPAHRRMPRGCFLLPCTCARAFAPTSATMAPLAPPRKRARYPRVRRFFSPSSSPSPFYLSLSISRLRAAFISPRAASSRYPPAVDFSAYLLFFPVPLQLVEAEADKGAGEEDEFDESDDGTDEGYLTLAQVLGPCHLRVVVGRCGVVDEAVVHCVSHFIR